MFKTSPYLLNRLVSVDSPTAKEFMKDLLKEEEQMLFLFQKVPIRWWPSVFMCWD